MNRPILLFVGIFLLSTAAFLAGCHKSHNDVSATSFESMNTFMKIKCYGENSQKAVRRAEECVKELETLFSATNPQSTLFALNKSLAQDATRPASPTIVIAQTDLLVASLLDDALLIAEATDGAFNPCLRPITTLWGFSRSKKENGNHRIPSAPEIAAALQSTDYTKVKANKANGQITAPQGTQFDFGGIAKGYAGDSVVAILKKEGVANALIDLGGNIVAMGGKPDGSPWSIGIRNPFEEGVCAVVKIADGHVITSGGYERYFVAKDGTRYCHIMDGKTGYPVNNDLASVTIIGKSGTTADGYSTALFVMGLSKALEYHELHKDFDYIIIDTNHKIHASVNIEILDKKFVTDFS